MFGMGTGVSLVLWAPMNGLSSRKNRLTNHRIGVHASVVHELDISSWGKRGALVSLTGGLADSYESQG